MHVIEKVVEGFIHGEAAADSLLSVGGGLLGLVSASAIIFVALTPFFALRNLSFALGSDRLAALMFGPGEPLKEADR